MIPDGSTPIKNEILIDIFAKGLLYRLEMRIVFYIIRWSWGFDKGKRRQDWTKSLIKTKIAKDLGVSRSLTTLTINEMVGRKILKVLRKPNTKGLCYQFNEHYKNWKSVKETGHSKKVLRKQHTKCEGNRTLSVKETELSDTGNLDQQEHSETFKETLKETLKEIVEFLNSTLSTNFRWQTKQTQNLIKGRLSEGFTIKDFKLVIRNRKDKWQNDDKMKEYLRPNTLFRPANFENYLQQAIKKEPKNQISNLLEKAQKDLVLHPSQDRLLAWLERLPKEWHSELQKYEYYWEAKNELEKEQKRKKHIKL